MNVRSSIKDEEINFPHSKNYNDKAGTVRIVRKLLFPSTSGELLNEEGMLRAEINHNLTKGEMRSIWTFLMVVVFYLKDVTIIDRVNDQTKHNYSFRKRNCMSLFHFNFSLSWLDENI
ncbi:hypothetical protein AVEN_154605-1 [Araneus ventricosus]|uniref:Uncharacterized protein n=1 Tax=Araneus ventricosus TaxID=182803 RepID=A0A4Y2F0S9_ARAVE|nr:hypothetical protein AVEN_154605-1 [Araneus ventricosus]